MAEDNDAPSYDAETVYKVILKAPVRVAGVPFYPLEAHEMRGGFLNRLIEENGHGVIDTATPVA